MTRTGCVGIRHIDYSSLYALAAERTKGVDGDRSSATRGSGSDRPDTCPGRASSRRGCGARGCGPMCHATSGETKYAAATTTSAATAPSLRTALVRRLIARAPAKSAITGGRIQPATASGCQWCLIWYWGHLDHPATGQRKRTRSDDHSLFLEYPAGHDPPAFAGFIGTVARHDLQNGDERRHGPRFRKRCALQPMRSCVYAPPRTLRGIG